MASSSIFHALGLHMHQPPGNLRLLMEANPSEAEAIIRCYERPVRYAAEYRDVARLHIGFSGVLLDQLLDPQVVDLYRHIVDIPAMLDRYAQADNIELIGMGHYHPIFPLIPRADWSEQLQRGRAVMQRVFGRTPRGFWPPEMAFTMEMIPALVEAGYDYVVVDGVHVRPEDGISDVFRPYLACHEGVCITVVPRDRDVSSSQQGGLDANWFQNEVRWRTGGSPRPHEPRLVTTWSDGENGAWFRQLHEGSGFFGYFFAPYMEHFRNGEYPITPVALSDYLEQHPAVAYAQVQTGAWNVGSASEHDLTQWAGTAAQRAAVTEVNRLSERYWDLRERLSAGSPAGPAQDALERARGLILEAETSCFLFWGEAWIPFLYERTGPAARELDEVEAALRAAAVKDRPKSASPAAISPPRDAEPAPAVPAVAAAAQPVATTPAAITPTAPPVKPAARPPSGNGAGVPREPVAADRQTLAPDQAARRAVPAQPAVPETANHRAPASAVPPPSAAADREPPSRGLGPKKGR